jgi:gas vesicle structural protein
MTIQPSGPSAVERSDQSQLADVVATILDKGVVVDVFARVSLVGIELLRADVRVVIASVDTYLRFAEAVGRLGMGQEEPKDLTGVVEDVTESGAKAKSKGALEAGAEKLEEFFETDEKEPAEARTEEESR